MDMIRLLLTLLDIVDVTATAVSFAAFGETWRRLGRVGDDKTASNMADIEQFIDLTHDMHGAIDVVDVGLGHLA